MSDRSIRDIAESCDDAFDNLLDRNFVATWPVKFHDLVEKLEEERARFGVWAAHIGAQAEHHASLDYRLRESEKVQSLVKSQLLALHSSLVRLPENLMKEGNNYRDCDTSYKAYKESHTEVPPEARSLPDSEPTSSEEDDLADQHEDFHRSRNAISRLNRLARAIRQRSIVSQTSKAVNFRPRNEEGNDEIEAFEQFCFAVIQSKWRNADESLQKRLAKVNASRRRLFLYRMKHQKVLGSRRRSSAKSKSSLPLQEVQLTHSTAAPLQQTSIISEEPPMIEDKPGSAMEESVAKASSFVESKFQPDTSSKASTSIGGTSVGSVFGRSRFPPPPYIPESRAEFECPYCCQLTSTRMLAKGHWKQHLIKDLEPYICLFENCAESTKTFREQTTWMKHMQIHATRWSCRLPGHSQGPKTVVLTSESAYAAHVRETHMKEGQFKETQIPTLARQAAIADPNPFKSCPFCAISGEALPGIPKFSFARRGSAGAASTTTAVGLAMQKHIAWHLQDVASYSLPWLDEFNDQIPSDKASSSNTESTLSSGSNEDYKQVARRKKEFLDAGDISFFDPDIAPDESNSLEEWQFALSTEYNDHATDPVLKPFIRRRNIEMVFGAGGAAKKTVLPCVYMPLSRNTDFFGRKATLDDLRDALLPQEPANDEVGKGTNNIKSFSILGPAGIGKTQVVIEFVHLHMHCFDAVFWIHADERSKIIEDVNKITKQLGLVDEASADSDDQILTRDLFKTWLENPVRTFASTSAQSRASWLLILDHVIDPKILDEFWPAKGETGSILITSRRNTLWNAATYPSGTLQPFTPEEAVDFIGILAQRDMSEEERQCARLISDKVKGYPLALKYLTGGIVEQNISFAEFLIQDHGRSAKRRRNINPVVRFIDNEEHSFLESAFDSISHSRPLLDVLSMLDPDHIPLDILKAPSTGFRLPGYPSTEQALRSSVQQLFKYSLVVKNKIPESLLMHRIVQDAARKQMEPDYYRAVFNACVTLISSKWPFREFTWRHGTSRWDQCEELLPHVMTLRGFASKHNTRMDDLHGAFAYARLVCDCGWYCHERGKTTESDMFGSIAQKICEELKQFYPLDLVNADKNPSEQQVADALAEILHNRGVVAVEVNWRRESLEHLTRFNEMMLQELGDRPAGQDMRLALSFNELGCAYMLRDNFEKGEECFQKSISSMEKLDNFEKWQISLPLVNLGFVYWLIGRNSEALDVLLEGLSVRERKFGYNDRESFITGRFLYALGNAYASLEMFDESLQYHGRALDHYRETLGSRHHRTADTYIRIADNFLRLKDGEHALALVEKAIQIYLSSAAFTAEAARARYWKSKVLRKLGQVKGAENEEKEALKLYREARQKFQDIMPEDKRPFEELEGVDFDRLIVFWSR